MAKSKRLSLRRQQRLRICRSYRKKRRGGSFSDEEKRSANREIAMRMLVERVFPIVPLKLRYNEDKTPEVRAGRMLNSSREPVDLTFLASALGIAIITYSLAFPGSGQGLLGNIETTVASVLHRLDGGLAVKDVVEALAQENGSTGSHARGMSALVRLTLGISLHERVVHFVTSYFTRDCCTELSADTRRISAEARTKLLGNAVAESAKEEGHHTPKKPKEQSWLAWAFSAESTKMKTNLFSKLVRARPGEATRKALHLMLEDRGAELRIRSGNRTTACGVLHMLPELLRPADHTAAFVNHAVKVVKALIDQRRDAKSKQRVAGSSIKGSDERILNRTFFDVDVISANKDDSQQEYSNTDEFLVPRSGMRTVSDTDDKKFVSPAEFSESDQEQDDSFTILNIGENLAGLKTVSEPNKMFATSAEFSGSEQEQDESGSVEFKTASPYEQSGGVIQLPLDKPAVISGDEEPRLTAKQTDTHSSKTTTAVELLPTPDIYISHYYHRFAQMEILQENVAGTGTEVASKWTRRRNMAKNALVGAALLAGAVYLAKNHYSKSKLNGRSELPPNRAVRTASLFVMAFAHRRATLRAIKLLLLSLYSLVILIACCAVEKSMHVHSPLVHFIAQNVLPCRGDATDNSGARFTKKRSIRSSRSSNGPGLKALWNMLIQKEPRTAEALGDIVATRTNGGPNSGHRSQEMLPQLAEFSKYAAQINRTVMLYQEPVQKDSATGLIQPNGLFAMQNATIATVMQLLQGQYSKNFAALFVAYAIVFCIAPMDLLVSDKAQSEKVAFANWTFAKCSDILSTLHIESINETIANDAQKYVDAALPGYLPTNIKQAE